MTTSNVVLLFLLIFDINLCLCQNYNQNQTSFHDSGLQKISGDPMRIFQGRYSHEPVTDMRRLGPRKNAAGASTSLKEIIRLTGLDRRREDTPMMNDPQSQTFQDPDYALSVPLTPRENSKIRQLKKNLESLPNANTGPKKKEILGVRCDFERACHWTWNSSVEDGFKVVSSADMVALNRTSKYKLSWPSADASDNVTGHYLHLSLLPTTGLRIVRSPVFKGTRDSCKLDMYLHQNNMFESSIKVIMVKINNQNNSVVAGEIRGDNYNSWIRRSFILGRNTQEFYVELEIVPNNVFSEGVTAAHLSLDRLRLVDCFPEGAWNTICTATQIRCEANQVPVCINASRICDITKDCDGNEDEMQDCDKIPFGGRCSFETGWCGWTNGDGLLKWSRHQGSTPTANTGPESDHTHQSKTGFYMYVNMDQRKDAEFTSNAALDSVTFNPPPRVHGDPSSKYYNSCTIRFYYHKYGKNPGSIRLILLELKARDNTNRDQLWFTSRDEGRDWVRAEVILPNVTHRYVLQFEARKGMRIYGDVAIDDFSLSPECFGLNIPAADLNGYNYWDPQIESSNKEPHADFVNRTIYEFTTCHASGRFGPKPEDCIVAYNNTPASGVAVATREPYAGMQLWTVPNEGHYTIIAKGAGGGQGSDGVGSSRGATARAVLELHKQEQIYLLVGQQGLHACVKTLSGKVDPTCEYSRSTASEMYHSKTQQVKNTRIQDGGGGGGGGTFVFLINNNGKAIPLIIAAGGGGLGVGRFLDDSHQHGHEYNASRAPHSGDMYGKPNETAGAGGGWRPYMGPITAGFGQVMGTAVLYGGTGGAPCYPAKGGNGQGGFGGGGGGCTKGGGGGGFSGGDTSLNSTNGGGGFSYITPSRTLEVFSEITPGSHSGSGQVFIIPAISGCGCDYRCIALDEFMSDVRCICPDRWKIGNDNTSCIPENENIYVYLLVLALIFITIVLVVALGALLLVPYNRYQRRKQEALRQRAILEQDLTLNRLRSTTDESALTNFNPNYGCDGLINGNVDVKSLPQVARESLRLVKALGQGAFGEVFQGLYRHRDGDAVEMPVAVKTLPDMSTGQSESDFLMEAAIMAKFSHPNIVHLIGVCFDRHPRFIVLELLAGGDLKNFLREGRNKPILTMKDLMFCALDVAKGCRYMEGKRFIHRDIAARNCLLTSKGPGRVVKIADFGMARDIYRSDYYRKGGKAMLPIKWMPPEAFLDGIFTSKTDVWSFGVLLWEVFSLGIMPYTGLANRDVMQLVTGGGRLDIPPGCPTPLYRVMCECWCPTPENRPSFSQLFERITVCTQDPEIMNAPLPSFTRLPSSERDATIMRPPGNDNSCLEVPNSSDYLIPLPGPAPPQSTSTDRLLDTVDTPVLTDVTWETRFMLSSNQSNKPMAEKVVAAPPGPLVEKLISIDTPQQTPTNTQAPINIEQTIAVAMATKMSNYSGNMAASQNGDPPNDPKLLTNSLTNGIITDKQLTDKLNHNQSIPMTHLSSSQNNTKHTSAPDKSLVLNVSQLDIQNTFINKPYANVTMNDNDASLKKNGPYTIQNQGLKSAPYLNNDSEISC